MLRTIAVSVAVLALSIAPALAAGEKMSKAKRVYKQFCAHCHGLSREHRSDETMIRKEIYPNKDDC